MESWVRAEIVATQQMTTIHEESSSEWSSSCNGKYRAEVPLAKGPCCKLSLDMMPCALSTWSVYISSGYSVRRATNDNTLTNTIAVQRDD